MESWRSVLNWVPICIKPTGDGQRRKCPICRAVCPSAGEMCLAVGIVTELWCSLPAFGFQLNTELCSQLGIQPHNCVVRPEWAAGDVEGLERASSWSMHQCLLRHYRCHEFRCAKVTKIIAEWQMGALGGSCGERAESMWRRKLGCKWHRGCQEGLGVRCPKSIKCFWHKSAENRALLILWCFYYFFFLGVPFIS